MCRLQSPLIGQERVQQRDAELEVWAKLPLLEQQASQAVLIKLLEKAAESF